MTANALPSNTLQRAVTPLRTVLANAYRGLLSISHNGLALLGMVLLVALLILSTRPDLRASAEQQLLGWLLQRQESMIEMPRAGDAAPANPVDTIAPADLPKAQANVAQWLSRKYRVAAEPMSVLVAEAFAIGQKSQLDPSLILAVMAIESRFNPYAQSPVGAQGLMQVMTRVHTDKYDNFGGHFAAFDPLTNLRVGVKVLQECIARAGSLEGGLRYYVGAANLPSDGGYASKVLAEHARLRQVAAGGSVPSQNAPAPRPAPQLQATTPAQTIPVKAPAPSLPDTSAGEKVASLGAPAY